MSPLKGVKFLRDKRGEKTTVVIDLRKNACYEKISSMSQ